MRQDDSHASSPHHHRPLGTVLWVVSLFAVAWASAQTRGWTPTDPVVLAGDDVGFRVEWMFNGVPTGAIVVRIDGEWVEARVGNGPPGSFVIPVVPLLPDVAPSRG